MPYRALATLYLQAKTCQRSRRLYIRRLTVLRLVDVQVSATRVDSMSGRESRCCTQFAASIRHLS